MKDVKSKKKSWVEGGTGQAAMKLFKKKKQIRADSFVNSHISGEPVWWDFIALKTNGGRCQLWN